MIELLHVDCMAYMGGLPDKAFDLAIIDPPYGVGAHKQFRRSNPWSARQKNGTISKVKLSDYGDEEWDNEPPGTEYFQELFRVSKNQIIWGANHFIDRMPKPSSCWIVWDKVNGASDQADCELAWTSFSTATRIFPFMWAGMMQGLPGNGRRMQGNKKLNEKRIHPTQKPVELYRWLLQNYAKPGDRILDTHCGSGSIAIACAEEGFDLTATEKSLRNYTGAMARIESLTT